MQASFPTRASEQVVGNSKLIAKVPATTLPVVWAKRRVQNRCLEELIERAMGIELYSQISKSRRNKVLPAVLL